MKDTSFTWISDQSESAEWPGELRHLGVDFLVVKHVSHEGDVVVAVGRGLRPEMQWLDCEAYNLKIPA